MKKKKQQKVREKAFWSNFYHLYARLPLGLDEIPQHIPHVRCRGASIHDEDLRLMTSVVKSIDMLDLDDTVITNAGVAHLTRLEVLKELRLKECPYIDNGCLLYLNQITSLELLHLGSTEVTLDGLTSLYSLANLRLLLVSCNEEEGVAREKLNKVAILLPQCKLVVNHQDFEPDADTQYE